MLVAALLLCLLFVPVGARAEELSDTQGTESEQILPAADDQQVLTATFDIEQIKENGNIVLSLSSEEVFSAFGFGDLLNVSFLDQTIELRLTMTDSFFPSGTNMLFASRSDGVMLAIKGGDFATTYGIANKTTAGDDDVSWEFAEGVEGPVQVTITLKEKSTRPPFPDINHGLRYKNNREDYPQLSDEEFTNFRVVSTTGMGENILYRTSNPVNPRRSRSPYADAALRDAGVTVIMNLSENEDELLVYEGYDQTYYSTVSHVAHRLGLSFTSDSFKSLLGDEMRFFAQNPGVYAVHCIEGKDRTGFAIALLECLMGASEEEVIADYMVTFYNYFGVTPDDDLYTEIYQDNIVTQLKNAYEVDSLSNVDLAKEAEEYLLSCGLTSEEVAQLKENLNPTKWYQVTFDANGHGTAPEAQTVKGGSCATRPDDLTAEGFTFGGWYLDEACTKPYDFSTAVTQDVTLYAAWTAVPSGEDEPEDPDTPERKDSPQNDTSPSKNEGRPAALPKTSDPFDARLAIGLVVLGLVLTLIGALIRRNR